MTSKAERRRFPRREYQVAAIVERKKTLVGGRVLNISEEGLALEVPESFDAGDEVGIEFLPPGSQSLANLRGVVCYVNHITQTSKKGGRESFYWVGIQFLDVPLMVREQIKNYALGGNPLSLVSHS